MATLDLTTFTETDPNSKITVTSTKADWSALSTTDSARVFYDFGAAFFNGNFEHLWEAYVNSGTTDGTGGYGWALANVNTLHAADGETVQRINVRLQDEGAARINLQETFGTGQSYQDFDALSYNTLYYCKTIRDESVGTYGTLYNYVYSDSGRTTLVATQTLTLHGLLDFRYFYAMTGQGSGSGTLTGYTQNFDIGAGGGATLVPSMATLGVGA